MLIRQQRRFVPPPTIEAGHFPAPVGGMNTIAGGTTMPPGDCPLLYNLIGSEYGLRSRAGYAEWCTGLTGASDNYVRSMLAFTGSAASGANDRLFACTSTGIWDVTSSGATTTARANSTAYALGDYVTASSTTFACVVAGTTGVTALPSVWVTLTVYAINDRVINDGNAYICTTGGTSGATGPTGTGTGIADGTVVWNFVSVATAITDGTVTWSHKPSNVAPTLVHTFATQTGRAGHGTAHVVVTAAGHFLAYCDEENGLIVYTESGGAWAAVAMGGGASQISGVDPINFAQLTVFKGRIWAVQKNTASLWYSGTGSLYGAYTQFNLGTKFKAGGDLKGVWNWTYDGGSGVDDALVAISSGGDVAIYQGTDPSAASTFGLKGVWFAGAMPAGRQIATSFGGDMLILSRSGLMPLSKLVVGAGAQTQAQYSTAKIANLFNQYMSSRATTWGWSVRINPEDNALLVTVPTVEGQNTTQLAMSLSTQGWSQFRDLPIYSAETFGGTLYFGNSGGKVYKSTGDLDNVLISSGAYTTVQFAGLTRFETLGNARKKRLQIIRPQFLYNGPEPSYRVAARYDFDLSELATVTYSPSDLDGWDAGVWDAAIWGGDFAALNDAHGAVGVGSAVAVAFRGASASRTVLVGFDVMFDQGGML